MLAERRAPSQLRRAQMWMLGGLPTFGHAEKSAPRWQRSTNGSLQMEGLLIAIM
jgi:hypothetical protein